VRLALIWIATESNKEALVPNIKGGDSPVGTRQLLPTASAVISCLPVDLPVDSSCQGLASFLPSRRCLEHRSRSEDAMKTIWQETSKQKAIGRVGAPCQSRRVEALLQYGGVTLFALLFLATTLEASTVVTTNSAGSLIFTNSFGDLNDDGKEL